MSRDFKDEYETYLENEIPDLWSRIEPKLADKPAVKTVKKRKKRNLTFYYGIAAAGLLLAISVPVALRFASGGQRMDNSSSGGAQYFAADMEQGTDAGDSGTMNAGDDSIVYQEEAAESEGWEDSMEFESMESNSMESNSMNQNDMAPAMESAGEPAEDSFLSDHDMENNGSANAVVNDGSVDESDGVQANDQTEASRSEILVKMIGTVQDINYYKDRIVYLLIVSEVSEAAGVSADDAVEIVQYLSDQEDPVLLPVGQTVSLVVLKNTAGTYELAGIESGGF